jgi:hypothetical protein
MTFKLSRISRKRKR